MITKIEVVDEEKFGTLSIERKDGREGLAVFFNRCRLTRDVKIKLRELKKMIKEGETPYGKSFLDCYDGDIIFKVPNDSEVRMGMKKTFPVTKPDQKKNYIFIETWPSEYHMFPSELLFEIQEIKNALALFKTNSLQKRKIKVAQ